MSSARDILVLNGAPHPDLQTLDGAVRRRATWEAMGFEITDTKTSAGLVARYRGHAASFWTLDHEGDGWAGMIWGSSPVQGHGVLDERAWYFRARYDAWTFELARDLETSPLDEVVFWWREDYARAGDMADGAAWRCIERAVAMYRDPLVQWVLATSGDAEADGAARGTAPYRESAARPVLELAWRDTTCWPLMASAAAQLDGPVFELRRLLWTFGVHPGGDPRDEWPAEFPLECGYDEATHARALEAVGGKIDAFDRSIADALRAVWAPPSGSRFYFVR